MNRVSRTTFYKKPIRIFKLICLLLTIILWRLQSWKKTQNLENTLNHNPSKSKLETFKNSGVVCGAAECSAVGKDVLKDGGNAMDAAIATGLCMGVVIPESMGLGGGHIALIYDRKTRKLTSYDARECAPEKAYEGMFKDVPLRNIISSGLSTGVPGEIKGYWEAHKAFGKLPWKKLFSGAIDKARNGFKVHEHLLHSMEATTEHFDLHPEMRELFINNETGKMYKIGETMKLPKLAETLEKLASIGPKIFYNGELGKSFVKDVQNAGGILTMDDLQSYRVKWREPVSATLNNRLRFYGPPAPSSGPILAFILNVMDGYNFSTKDSKSTLDFRSIDHLFVEAMKFGYAVRSELADPDYVDVKNLQKKLMSLSFADETRKKILPHRTFNPNYYGAKYLGIEDHGTAHISVIDADGNAVSLTSSINLFFGSKLISKSTGIIIGNTMDDFTTNDKPNRFRLMPSVANKIKPGKRPYSSMCPSIFIDEKDDVRLVIGGAGGTKITTAVALVVMRHLWLDQNIKEAIDSPRLHHQLFPNIIFSEEEYPKEEIRYLEDLGHEVMTLEGRPAIVQGIAKVGPGIIQANSDYRKGGSASGI